MGDFIKFVNNAEIYSTAIATIIGLQSKDLVNSFMDGIVRPITNTRKKLTTDITLFGVTFKIANVINSFIEFIIVLFILYMLNKLRNTYFKRIKL